MVGMLLENEIVRILLSSVPFRRAVCRWGSGWRPDIVYAEARRALRRKGLRLSRKALGRVVRLAEAQVIHEETCGLYPPVL